ncbi:zinc-binding dehydrogenase [Micromonospora tulbaghiae]|uniref:NADPH2:quinone reductase n=1 Tax=Micromonospora tulbaghiae TaxID=479978 RepID=A0ABY0KEM9_9ACTN|nr:zinc-binding dehydrogenase [Micromonospora tulbaghiae]MDX5456890.1 zinc-binding dehydrogenase [Micromonospora tulbaghiae]SCE63792.1 NADPH2:quinone reductase [Micromonospora tulbaghiae]
MRAVWLREFGGPEVLVPGTAPDPAPGPGQVLVDVAHANITFVETMFRASGFGPFRAELPVIPGNGVGGTITALGAGADPALAGRVVVTATGGTGGYAERVVVDQGAPVPVPPGLALDAAVALMADGRTALMLARAAGLRPGDRVLVEAAAGGVGSLLTQLAATAGAVVVGAAGGARKVDLLRAADLDVVVDYRQAGWTGRVRDAVGAVDVVFDGVGGPLAREAFDLLDPGGRMLSFGLAGGAWADIPAESAAARGVTLLSPRPGPDELRALTEAALAEGAAGRLRPLIGQRFPLERAAAAHAAIGARETVGKTLLDVR